MDPVFTPDGQKVMFRSNHEGDWHLYTVGLDGANLKRVIGQLSASQFCLSPLLSKR
jgi:Tol biopolymer transport system component